MARMAASQTGYYRFCYDHITPNFDVLAAIEFLSKNPADMTMKYGSICIRSNQCDWVGVFRTHRDIKDSLMTILVLSLMCQRQNFPQKTWHKIW
jgi:hypothetical protein